MIDWKSKQCMISQKYQKVELYYLRSVFDIYMIFWRWIYRFFCYYIYRSNNISIVWWWYEDQYFFSGDLSFHRLLILIDCLWLGKKWTGYWWACGPYFRCELKDWLLKRVYKNYYNLKKNWTYVGNTKEKRTKIYLIVLVVNDIPN